MKLSELRKTAAHIFKENGVDRPLYTADLILSSELSVDRNLFAVKRDDEIPPHKCEAVFSKAAERIKRLPLSYILGEAEFFGRVFKVGSGVLIPRPETELLVEAVLSLTPDGGTFADWCTGSGCIGITLMLENSRYKRAVAVDSSVEALRWAEANVKLYGLEEKVNLVQNENPEEFSFNGEKFDFITANPPYIPSGEIDGLMKDVRDYEPHEALDGGLDGLSVYKKLFGALPNMLKHGGLLCFETGGDAQCESLVALAPQNISVLEKIYDYSGILRHIIWRKNHE